MRNKYWVLVILSIVLVTALLLPACSQPAQSSDQGSYLKGWANPDKPVSGATVKILDSSGKVLQETKNVTNENGTFILKVSNLPANFQLVVNGGKQDGQDFSGELKASFQNFNPTTDIAYIQAESQSLLGAAPASLGAPKPLGGPEDTGLWIAQQLGAGALSYIGGKSFGSALDALGMGVPTTTDILNAIAQIKSQLDSLQVQINQLANQLNAVEYNTAVRQLDPLINVIQSTYEQLKYYANTTITDADKRKKDQQALMDIIRSQILTQPNQFRDFLIGAGQTQGLIVLWSKVVAVQHRFFGPADSAKQRAMFDYYDQLQAVQLELIVEYYHANKDSDVMINDAINRYKKNRADELALLPKPVPEEVRIVGPSAWSVSSKPDIMIYPCKIVPPWQIDMVSVTKAGNYAGFTKWYLPYTGSDYSEDHSDIRRMFGRESINAMTIRDWAIAQGWPADKYPEGDYFFYTGSHSDRTGKGPMLTYFAAGWEPFEHFSMQSRFDAYILPVRDLEPGEFYFYK